MQPLTPSQLADALKPYVTRWMAETNSGGRTVLAVGGPPSSANYVLSIVGAECHVHDGLTGRLILRSADHAAVIQQAIDLAGVGGVLAFRTGDYWLSAPLRPLARQSWQLPFHAVFRPTGDNRIIQAVDIDWWCVYGTLHIEDTDRRTTTAEAVYLDGVNGCYFADIFVWDYHRGMALWGLTRRAYENVFASIRLNIVRHEGLVIKAEVGDNYFGSVFIKGPSTVEWATGSGLLIGLYPGAGTIFGGIMFGRVETLDCHVNVDLQGLYEVWFAQLLSDNAYFAALYIGDRVERLFVGTIWAAGSGDGIWIQGSPASTTRRLRIDQIFCWVNAQHGVHFNGWVEDVSIGSLYLLENQVAQLRFSRGRNRNISIDSITVAASGRIALDAGGIDSAAANVSIAHADIDGGECMGLDLLRCIDGMRDGKRFRSRGVAYIPIGQSFTAVPHGLEGRPLYMQLTPHHYEARQAFVSAFDLTNLLIDAGAPVAATARVAWEAQSGVEVGGELLANPDVDGNPPANWVAFNGALVETADVYNGATALRILGGFHEWKSDPFPAAPFARYRLLAYVKGTGNAFTELTLRFWQVTGGWLVLSEGKIALSSVSDYAGGYVRVQADFSAPAGAEAADVTLRCLAAPTTDVYADDAVLRAVGGPNLLTNASLESGGAVPDGWTLNGVTWASGTARTGTRSLRLVHGSSRIEARAQWAAVTPGADYELGVWFQGVASGNVAIVAQWYSDAGGIGNLIREDVQYVVGAFPGWTWVQSGWTAPASAQSVYFILRMEGWSACDLRADAFSVRQLI